MENIFVELLLVLHCSTFKKEGVNKQQESIRLHRNATQLIFQTSYSENVCFEYEKKTYSFKVY